MILTMRGRSGTAGTAAVQLAIPGTLTGALVAVAAATGPAGTVSTTYKSLVTPVWTMTHASPAVGSDGEAGVCARFSKPKQS